MSHLFEPHGVHAVVDGQFGSTGKGALSAALAEASITYGVDFAAVISNAGPNSGHTFYYDGVKHVLKQLPCFAAYRALRGDPLPVVLTAGAIIDPEILIKEAEQYPEIIYVHPNAAVITSADKDAEHSGTVAAVAGTRSGTGVALARKVLRDPTASFGDWYGWNASSFPKNVMCDPVHMNWRKDLFFMEVSQGFSLGLNQQFYPKCTSRECTVSQALSDASLPPQSIARTFMAMRTYPIRVGNVDGHSSGEWYGDQREITWDEIGQPPELTTVTQRQRRIASFSLYQLREALAANHPDFVFMNFMNYLPEDAVTDFRRMIRSELDYYNDRKIGLIEGWGPEVADVLWSRWK